MRLSNSINTLGYVLLLWTAILGTCGGKCRYEDFPCTVTVSYITKAAWNAEKPDGPDTYYLIQLNYVLDNNESPRTSRREGPRYLTGRTIKEKDIVAGRQYRGLVTYRTAGHCDDAPKLRVPDWEDKKMSDTTSPAPGTKEQ